MSEVRISELPLAGPITGSELVEIVQGGQNRRTTTGALGGGGGGGIPDAPADGKTYGRENTAWVEVNKEGPAGPQGPKGDKGDPGSASTEVNVQTGTAYTLVLTDAFKMVIMDNVSANTLTVPPNTAVAFPVNTRIDIGQDGTGQTTIAAGTGVTIRTPETRKLRKQWSKASLICRAVDVWDIVGDMEAAT